MGKVIYISGKINGISRSEASCKFRKAEDYFKRRGWDVVNPMSVGKIYEDYKVDYKTMLLVDMHLLHRCDAIYMLDNYTTSPGAKAELAYAKAIGLEIYKETNINK